jgi:hypothetical protein
MSTTTQSFQSGSVRPLLKDTRAQRKRRVIQHDTNVASSSNTEEYVRIYKRISRQLSLHLLS